MNGRSLRCISRRAMASAACAAVVCLQACTVVGPDYERPDLSAQLPERWLEQDNQRGDRAEVSEISAWWAALGDPELNTLIERALTGSFELSEARERIIAARARRGIANADRLPSLDAEASYKRAHTGTDGLALGGAPPGTEVDIYSLGAVAGWELDLWGRVARLVEAADARVEFAIEDYRAARVSLAAEVAREFVTIRSIDQELRIVRSSIAADTDTLDIARARAAAGFGNDLEVARAARVLETDQSTLPGLWADRRAGELRLAVLLGVRPGDADVSDPDGLNHDGPDRDRTQRDGTGAGLPRRDVVPSRGVPADLLLRRPDLRRAERDLAEATAQIGAQQAERFPRVSLSGSIALQGTRPGDMFNTGAYTLQAGPTISIPVFQGGRIDRQVLEAQSQQRQAILRLQAATIAALSEVETASMRRDRAEERVARLLSAEIAANHTERLSLDRYTAGAADFLDVTEARSQRLAVERSRVQAERDALLRLVDLYAALGGGWPSDSPLASTAE